jgi:hypothetical protein
MVSSCEESLGIANFFSLGVVILRLVSMGMGCIRECDHCSFVARSVDGVLQEMCMGGDLPYSLSRAVWLPPAWSLAHAICSTETVVRGPSQVCRSLLFHGTRHNVLFGANDQRSASGSRLLLLTQTPPHFVGIQCTAGGDHKIVLLVDYNMDRIRALVEWFPLSDLVENNSSLSWCFILLGTMME